MTEKNILPYIEGILEPIRIWKDKDARSQVAPSPDNAWLKMLCKKI